MLKLLKSFERATILITKTLVWHIIPSFSHSIKHQNNNKTSTDDKFTYQSSNKTYCLDFIIPHLSIFILSCFLEIVVQSLGIH